MTKIFNWQAERWSRGEIDWLYQDGRNVLVKIWNRVIKETGSEEKAMEAVEEFIRSSA